MSATIVPSDPFDDAGATAERFVRADGARTMEAVERLVGGGRQRARRFVEHLTARGTPMDHLWCALDRRGRVAASALAVPSPGRTAMVFASPPMRDEGGRCAALVRHLCADIARHDIALAQVLLPETATDERTVLLAAGFRDLTTLVSMERPLPGRGDIAVPALPAGATIEPWDHRDRATLIRVLDASYEATLDCPGLCGLRRTEDILDGHLHSGRLERTLWSILRVDGAPCGAILLSPSGCDAVELVYLGLARTVRGRGFGTILLRHGLSRLVGRNERLVCLAVDADNAPAFRLYRALGFRPAYRRRALIRPLAGA